MIFVHADQPQFNSVHSHACTNCKGLAKLLVTGCEENLIVEDTSSTCNIPACALAQSLPLRFTDGRLDWRIRTTVGVKCGLARLTCHDTEALCWTTSPRRNRRQGGCDLIEGVHAASTQQY